MVGDAARRQEKEKARRVVVVRYRRGRAGSGYAAGEEDGEGAVASGVLRPRRLQQKHSPHPRGSIPAATEA